jgi:DNA-binding GntR family transcriptional regulator
MGADQQLKSALAVVGPVERRPNDNAAVAVHEQLRRLILNGSLPPGATLNQVELAPLLGVSRTPVREAIRMLQEEGLVEAEPQKKARIVGFEPAHLEAVYVQRIVMEGLAATLTAARGENGTRQRLNELLAEMQDRRAAGEMDEWQVAHRLLHVTMVQGVVGSQLEAAMKGSMERSERYRYLYPVARSGEVGEIEHREIVDAFEAGDGSRAGQALTSHLARTALTLIAELAPSYDPVALRGAVEQFE